MYSLFQLDRETGLNLSASRHDHRLFIERIPTLNEPVNLARSWDSFKGE